MAMAASASASASSALWSIFSKKRILLQAQQRPASKFLKFCSASNVGARTCTSAELQWRQNLPSPVLRNRSRRSSVFMVLPALNAEEAPSGEKSRAKWSHKAIKAVCLGQVEAFRMKYLTTGTEALLLGILLEGTSVASRFLREIGINVLLVRAKVLQMRGRPYKYIERSESPPLTESSKKVLEWAVDESRKLGEDLEVTNLHILLGIWAQKGTAGQQILANMGFDDKKAEELAEFARDEIASSSF